MSGLSTHVLDTSLGRPVAGMTVSLALKVDEEWRQVAEHRTDAVGRVKHLLPGGSSLAAASYRLCFQTAAYFASQSVPSLYPVVEITFVIRDPSVHHHIPLLLAANGYSTYRGS